VKFLILVGDGMADWPLESHDSKTPLELARTPNMDRLASLGRLALFKTIPDKCAPGSEIGNMSLMGYNPEIDPPWRGPLEALSANVSLSPTEIAFRCNFITIEKDIIDDYSAGHISTEEGQQLIQTIQTKLHKPGIDFFPGVQYRHILRLDGTQFSDQLDCTPPHDQIGKSYKPFLVKPKSDSDIMAQKTAQMLNNLIEKSHEVLKEHPINTSRITQGKKPATHVWFWSGGKRPAIQSFQQKYGKSGAVISAVDLVFGIGIAAGLEPIHVPGVTGLLDTNYAGKINTALEALKSKDFVYVHVEAPDEMAHAGDVNKKVQAIEDFDAKIVGPAFHSARKFPEGLILAVATDHSTPIKIRTHARDMVPIVIYDTRWEMKQTKKNRRFTEKDARNSKLPIFSTGGQFMRYFLSSYKSDEDQ
jgi:2,3-bisphosphoglycerate-independent phosphoglycerate mutase